MLGYLSVRAGVHALVYAKTLETLTGADMKMLPPPQDIEHVFRRSPQLREPGIAQATISFQP
ncbi:MAG: manganese catalase family protein [Bryobacterales bacterium]|nr:manganese catalase family protein [Bryobacterales bacterium]